ncbi:unnamed protein product [Schistosoma bovis]|uniref:Arf-GAP with dual PH domain-containing protein 1 n=1 Tax=Schistosoma bovis TaxID=6184 RepID=A0A430QIA7_SCHBO|nr:uncharacterized protein DC041_0008075 [Schistosoma bovis]CAH8511283.1 unnamed protein product [Schistosoma bovis]
MSNCDEHIKNLREQIDSPCNKICADCHHAVTKYASLSYGVFLCELCGVSHQTLNGNIKRISTDEENSLIWSDDNVSRLKKFGGNKAINQNLEASLPVYFRRPWPGVECPIFLREAFIKSKYIHEEFTSDAIARGAQSQFACSFKSGVLLKKLRDSTTFCERFFELSVEGNYFRYYIKPSDSQPKQSLDLERLNFTFIPSKDYGLPPHTALIQFVQDCSTRHMFIRSEDSRTIINWYNAIRLGKYHRLCLGLSGMGVTLSPAELSKRLTRDVDMAGWLSKTGPRKNDAWRRRWCMILNRHFLYTDNPLSPFAKGELFIGSNKEGYSVTNTTPDGWNRHNGYPLTIHTSARPFVFVADKKEEQEKWLEIIQKIMNMPLTLAEHKQAAMVTKKRTNALDFLKTS